MKIIEYTNGRFADYIRMFHYDELYIINIFSKKLENIYNIKYIKKYSIHKVDGIDGKLCLRNIIYTDSKEEIKIWKDLMNLDISEYVLVSASHEIYSLVLKK